MRASLRAMWKVLPHSMRVSRREQTDAVSSDLFDWLGMQTKTTGELTCGLGLRWVTMTTSITSRSFALSTRLPKWSFFVL